jgi:hypothetical protein
LNKTILLLIFIFSVFSVGNAQSPEIGIVGPAANGWPDGSNRTPDIMLTNNGDGTYSIDVLQLSDGEARFRSNKVWTQHPSDTPDEGGRPAPVTDTDGKGNPDYQDLDSDNDGIPDLEEGGTDPSLDADGDGVLDDQTDTDGDGIADSVDQDNGGTPADVPDTDGDGTPDYQDLDSDDDGIPDLVEGGTDPSLDADGDGVLDDPTDTDGDGMADSVDPDDEGTPATVPDTDGDGIPDYQDLDSDDDGIPDLEEGGTDLYLDADDDGVLDDQTDTDGDGIADSVDPDDEGTPAPVPDTDGDGIPDYLDLNTASVQIIHNSADPAAQTVDVYINGTLTIDDLEFRTATAFVDVPAGTPIDIDIAPGTSSDVSESIYNLNTTLTADETYVGVADGVLNPTQFDDSVNTIDFGLEVYTRAQQSSTNAGETSVLVHHGATDAPTVYIVNDADQSVLLDDISYTEFDGYLDLPTADYIINVEAADNSAVVQSYDAPLQKLGLSDTAVTVVASGFLDPAANQNGEAFGLWAAQPASGPLVELPLKTIGTDEFADNNFSYYPNPVKQRLNLNTNGLVEDVTIYNMLGQEVIHVKPNKESPQINIKNHAT